MGSDSRACERHDASELFTEEKVLLMLLPSVVTIVMHATRISASMTAYSTAVGPSSLTTNRRTFESDLAWGSPSTGNETDGKTRLMLNHLERCSTPKPTPVHLPMHWLETLLLILLYQHQSNPRSLPEKPTSLRTDRAVER